MSKKDLFVVIYCSIMGSTALILLMIVRTTKIMNTTDFVFLWNLFFLSITSSFVLIKPIRRWVDRYIIEKLP